MEQAKPARKKARNPIAQSTRFNVFRRDNFACRYCGRSSPDVVLHCDHATSVKDGGDDTEDNLVTSCMDCNLGKSSQSVNRDAPDADIPMGTKDGEFGLVGMWGHTFAINELGEKEICWQFKIIRQVSHELYACQCFSWWDGGATNCEIISTKTLVEDCKLYASNELMRDAYERACERIRAKRDHERYLERQRRAG